ncbi:MAG: putative toxin-antitoxin system toxin component, PIN family [Planctomycetales bacterium]
MRIVLDTNVLARIAYRPEGPAAALLDRFGPSSPHVVVLSFILSEVARVLRYPRLQRLHRLTDRQLQTFIDGLRKLGLIVEPEPSDISPLASDPDDDPVIATAIAGDADVLCTLDRHLHASFVTAACAARGIRVMTDVELLRELRTMEDDSPSE